ncbi:MAG: DUF2309 domain-containing protein [Pseudomonadota bacterium]
MNKPLTTDDREQIAAADPLDAGDLHAAALAACKKVAPLWPLKSFVAVNPMLGHIEEPFDAAAAAIARQSGATLLMDRAYYAKAMADGAATDADLRAALERLNLAGRMTTQSVRAALETGPAPAPDRLLSYADAAREATGEDWAAFAVDQISFWAGGYFDDGQAAWGNPWRDFEPYAAWRAQAALDRTPEIMGLTGFRAAVRCLPETPEALLAHAVERLGVPPAARQPYFHRLLATVAGWAGRRRYQGWRDELNGADPAGVIDILAIRAAYDVAVADCLENPDAAAAWDAARARMTDPVDGPLDGPALVAQTALEIAAQNRLVAALAKNAHAPQAAARPDAQAVFCIDVRSERLRRAIEATNPKIETFGFAGFFGFPIEVARLGEKDGALQCPVLLEPGYLIAESPTNGDLQTAIARMANADAACAAWKRFKTAAVSSFAFVEAMGLGFLGSVLRDAAGAPAREREPLRDVSAQPARRGDRQAGMSLDDRIATAQGALAGMSLGADTARVVLLVGHGSTTTNNPYASGLDCGACGGHTGEANARVAVEVLNDEGVRAGLAERGVGLPDDTIFVAALHDTTTDEIALFDVDAVPASHRQDLARLRRDLYDASRLVRHERAASLGLAGDDEIDAKTMERARDWSQVRPEWGLAGCAAFIAAPRARSAGADLGGRAFLHSYDWRADEDNAILELIMTAPLVVASWISLQYYASTTDNDVYGAGDKTLHNVVGGHGVLEGFGGDLRVGLPMQSVHDGRNPVHEPLRLTAVIEAPRERIDMILAKHGQVRALFTNRWLDLIAVTDDGASFARYDGDGGWIAIDPR